MGRGNARFVQAARPSAVSPLVMVRVLDMPSKADPLVLTSAYFVDAEEFISFFDENGDPEVYVPVGLSFDGISVDNGNQVTSFKVRASNVTREFCAMASQVELQGCTLELLLAFREDLGSPDAAMMLCSGPIQAPSINEGRIEVQVSGPMNLPIRTPQRPYWPKCGWEFGGDGCGYWSAPSNTNLAVQANAISGGDRANYPKTQAFDGSTVPWGTYPGWKSSQTGTAVAPNAYIGQSGITEQVRRIRVYGNGGTTMPDSIKVQYSLDGSSWTDILTYDASGWSGMGYFDIMLPDYGVDVTHSIRLLANADLGSGYSWWILEMIINGVNSGPLPSGGCARTLTACKAYGAQEGFGGFPHILKSRDPRELWTKS